jgi:hypothetical protein
MKTALYGIFAVVLFGLGFLTSGLLKEGNRRAAMNRAFAVEGSIQLGLYRLLHENIQANETKLSLEAVRMLMFAQRDKLLGLEGMHKTTSDIIDAELQHVEPILVMHGEDLPQSKFPYRYTSPPPNEVGEEEATPPPTTNQKPRKILMPP